MDVFHKDALSVSFDRNIHAIIHACLNTTEQKCDPQIQLCLFMFLCIALKQLHILATISTFTCHRGVKPCCQRSRVQFLGLTRIVLYFGFVVVVAVYLFVQNIILSLSLPLLSQFFFI